MNKYFSIFSKLAHMLQQKLKITENKLHLKILEICSINLQSFN